MKKINTLVCLAALAAPLSAQADFIGVSVGGGMWSASPSGTIQKTDNPGEDELNVAENLHWSSNNNVYAFATLEHPVPILPNARLSYARISQDGEGPANFTFDGVTYTGNASNDFTIETVDLLLYYEILDNVVSVDLGLNVRSLKVDYTITETGTSTSNSDSSSQTIPMLYGMVGASPIPDLLISGELSYIAYSGSTISDFTAKVSYTTSFFVGVEAGYRKQQYTFDDVNDTNADLSFDGVFAGAYVKF